MSINTGSERPQVSLACLQCQQRKRKCDKNSPCQACVLAGIACTAVSRARLPRGRHAVQRDNDDLRVRVARLERLLLAQKDDGEPPEPSLTQANGSTPSSAWSSISKEVVGIRELLDNLTGDEPDDAPFESVDADQNQGFDLLLYSDTSCFVQPHVLEPPTVSIMSTLLEIYLHRVDKVLKVIHVPSLHVTLLESTNLTPAQEALKYAVFSTAINSLDEMECLQLFNSNKVVLNNRFQLATEVLLSRAGLFTTNDLVALQAFVIYLVSSMCYQDLSLT
jgi:hypothetical protein